MPTSDEISAWWEQNAGVTPQAAKAIARSVNVESGGNPNAFNPAGGGQGAYGTMQWRGPRLEKLRSQPGYQDWRTQQQFALSEFQGGDPQAASAWNKIKNATDESMAYRLVRDNFARGEDSLGPGQHRWVGDPSYGEGRFHLGTLEKRPGDDLSPAGVALLNSILQQHYPSEDKSTGNSLLDSIMQSQVFGMSTPETAQALDTRSLQAATPPPPSPETVPELQPKPLQTAPLQPIQQGAFPAPPIPGTRDNPLLQPGPEGAVVGSRPIPGSLDRNSFWNPDSNIAPYNPPGVRDDRQPEARARPIIQPDSRRAEASILPQGLLDTGNALLNKILSSAPRLTAPRGGASLIGNLLGQPAPIPRAVPSPSTGSAAMDRRHAPDIEPTLAQRAGSALRQDLWDLVTGPFTSGGEQVKRAVETGEEPTAKQAIGDVLPVIGGSVVRPPGSLGAGIGLPGPREPPPISEVPRLKLTPAVEVGGKLYTGPTHGDAYDAALKANGGVDPGSTAASRNLFTTDDGAVLSHAEAVKLREGGAAPPIEPPAGGASTAQPPLTPPPGGNGPEITPPTLPDGSRLKVTRQKVQDLLNWTVRSRYADSIEAKHFIESLPPEFRDPNFRAGVGRDIERRLIDPNAELRPETRRFLDLPQVKALTDEEHALGTELRKLLTPGQADELGVGRGLRTVEEGHVHRMVEGERLPGEILPQVDPITGKPRPVGGRSLSKTASGVQHRSNRFVGQDDAGNRVWSGKRLDETMPPVPRGYTRFYSDGQGGWTPDRDVIRQRHPTGMTTLYTDFPTTQAGKFRVGDSYHLPDARRNARLALPEKYGDRYQMGHHTYTAREPTMTEMEANLPVRYHNDYLLGLVNNVNRMKTVVRNLHALNELKTKLAGEGLWVPRAGDHLHTPPTSTDAGGRPFRFERVNLPQLDGWAHPRIANTINDFAKGFTEPNLLERINNVLIGSLFILPVGHIRNVGTHYVIGRGLDWGYRNPQLLRSFNEVWHMGPTYQRFLRENGPAMYPGAADVHGKLVEKLLHDMARDEGWEITAKALGTTMKKLLPAMYNWSARTLWFANDHLFLARTLENLKRLGHADPLAAPSSAWQQAIAHTKREIPPYEIPDQILKSRGLQRLLMSPVFAFGRYTYDKYRILGENVKEMLGHHGKGMPQVDGAAKALLTLMLAFPVTSALNAALQQITGNKNARVYGAGPTTIARTVGTGLGRLAHVDPNSRLGWMLGMTPGEADFSHALSGILTFSPGLEALVKLFGGGHDPYTGQPIIGQHATGLGMAAQGLEALLGTIYPAEVGLRALREGPGALTEPFGFDLAGPRQPSAKGQRLQRGLERGRERHDPVEQLLRRALQGGQQPAVPW